MRASFTLVLLLCLAAATANAVELKVEKDHISGRVFDSSTNRGIGGLSVQLAAPKAMRQPVRITITTDEGAFQFAGLTEGKYLLTIYRGMELLYRKEIDNRIAQTFTVPLHPVGANEAVSTKDQIRK